jgi:hypothetical protein
VSENRLALVWSNREFSKFESPRSGEVAAVGPEKGVLDEGSPNLRPEKAIPRFDADVGAAPRENAVHLELLADIGLPRPFQLLVAPACQGVDCPLAVIAEGFRPFPNEDHWPRPTPGDCPRGTVAKGFLLFPNERHWPVKAEPRTPNGLDEEEPDQ